ncbi:MAG: glycosyltransferase [Phototrophicales bacterium]|nr:glycosyltransferase [Phototrophicales bacterium]
MAKIWCISAPLYSHTDWGGFLRTAQGLAELGHEVIWVSTEKLRGAIVSAGLPFYPIAQTGFLFPPPPVPDVTTIPPQEAVMLRYRRALDTWMSVDIVAEATQNLLDLAEKIGTPDLILTDPFLSASALFAEKIGVKMIVCGWQAQADLNADALFPVQRNLATDSQQRLAKLCDQFGLVGENFSKGATTSILSPHLHISYFTPRWYIAEAGTLLGQNVFVGGIKPTPKDVPPAWLTDIPQDVPLALITLGTTFTGDLGFYSWAAQAAAREGLLPVVAIGFNPIAPQDKAMLVKSLPQGTRLVNFVPFEHVLPRCKIMIHHGGMGTTHYAVVFGVMQIVVPHAADQRVQAKRVAQARVGLNLTAHDVRQGMLKDGVRALVHDDKVQITATQLADEMANLGGVARAVDVIQSML